MNRTFQNRFNFDQVERQPREISPLLISAVTERIVRQLQPQQVLLFGSQANGNAKEGSDLDLLVVLNNQHALATLKRRERFGKLLELFRYRSFALDAMLLTEAEIQLLQEANEGEWDMVLEILAKGVMLYEESEKTQTKRACPPANTGMVSQSRT
jgi:predicted nucleotidyltransferase